MKNSKMAEGQSHLRTYEHEKTDVAARMWTERQEQSGVAEAERKNSKGEFAAEVAIGAERGERTQKKDTTPLHSLKVLAAAER